MFVYILLAIAGFQIFRWLIGAIKIRNLSQKSVFITGCDTGFGHLLALKCLQHGMTVFAGCLTETGGDSLTKLSVGLPGKLHIIRLDVTDENSVKKAAEATKTLLKGRGSHKNFTLNFKGS